MKEQKTFLNSYFSESKDKQTDEKSYKKYNDVDFDVQKIKQEILKEYLTVK